MESQALIVAFDQLRGHDEAQREAQLAGARMPFGRAERGANDKQ